MARFRFCAPCSLSLIEYGVAGLQCSTAKFLARHHALLCAPSQRRAFSTSASLCTVLWFQSTRALLCGQCPRCRRIALCQRGAPLCLNRVKRVVVFGWSRPPSSGEGVLAHRVVALLPAQDPEDGDREAVPRAHQAPRIQDQGSGDGIRGGGITRAGYAESDADAGILLRRDRGRSP